MHAVEQLVGRVVSRNNDRIRRAEASLPNPRPVRGLRWNDELVAAHGAIASEWDRFVDAGGRLPRIEDVVQEDQGNDGTWRAGLLVSRGRPLDPLAGHFPQTMRALSGVPGLWSALWSLMEPGTELHRHTGPNAGVLRYHLGVRCPSGAELEVGDEVVPYRDGEGILFDDTVPHAAWNRSEEPRVTLFLELLRPLPWGAAAANAVVQRLVALDRRYRLAPRRAAEWHVALNAG